MPIGSQAFFFRMVTPTGPDIVGNKDGGIGANEYTEEKGQGKDLGGFATEEKKGDNAKEGSQGRIDGPAKDLVDTLIDKGGDKTLPMAL